MANLYTQVEFPITVNLLPRMLHSGLYEELEHQVKRRLEGRCMAKIGYIKKGTVQIVKKQLGKSEGSHLTGNVTYHLQVRCSAALPIKGQKLACMVVSKNEFGVLATNYQLPAYSMLIMKMPDDTSDALDRIQRGSYIEVEVLASRLKADNQTERIRSEYWLICSLVNAKVEEARYQILPQVAQMPNLMANNQTYDLDTINDKRRELTGGTYSDLEETKNSIQQIRDEYIDMLRDHEDNIKNDIMLSALLGRKRERFILGILKEATTEGANPGHAIHTVEVLWSSISTLSAGKKIYPEVRQNRETVNLGAVVLYQDYDTNSATAESYSAMDFWGRHVKYIVNATEMVHPNGQYLNQLTRIISSRSDKVKSTKVKNRKVFTEDGKPIATLIYRDDHVINRAYYKMREFISFFGEEVFPRKSLKIACIAESPGGFIQALFDQRVYDPTGAPIDTGIHDRIAGASIGINDQPPWKDLVARVKQQYDYVHLQSQDDMESGIYDDDKTNVYLQGGHETDNGQGNILDPDNREKFYQAFHDEKADVITGDGGIERNKKETTEEMDTHRLLLAEVIMALNCQKQGGTFILKIYDMATEFTMNMIQVLCYCYDEVGLFKPLMSRAASSEKYIVCKRFQISEDERVALLLKLETVHKMSQTDGDMFAYYGNMIGLEDPKLKQAIISYNGFFMKQQISFIEDGRAYATLYNNTIKSGNVGKMTTDIMLAKIGTQVTTADEFKDRI